MDERPRDRGVEREEVVEHRVVERDSRVDRPVRESRPAGSSAWIWAIPLLIVVALLLWYVMSRGERTELEMPTMDAPEIEAPQPAPETP